MVETRRPPKYIELVKKHDPALLETIGTLNAIIDEGGALPPKVRLLMGILGDAILGRPDGVKALANLARAAGATDEEIAETVRMALHMAGIPGLVAATSAYKEDTKD